MAMVFHIKINALLTCPKIRWAWNHLIITDQEEQAKIWVLASNTSALSHPPFLFPVLRLVTRTDPTTAAWPPEYPATQREETVKSSLSLEKRWEWSPLSKPLINSRASSLLDGFSRIIPSYTTTSKSITWSSKKQPSISSTYQPIEKEKMFY